MASNIGPFFAIQATAPREWNQPGTNLAPELVLVGTQGVAWSVEVLSRSFREELLAAIEPRWIFLAQVIREDDERIYAFPTLQERALFIELKEIKEIGPKTAASIVAELGLEGVLKLLQGASIKGLKVPGVGPKTFENLQFGLGKRKEAFLRLIVGAQSAGAASSRRSADAGLKLSAISSDLFHAFEGLGLAPPSIHKLFEDCQSETEGFAALKDPDKLKLMLQRWGLSRQRLVKESPDA
jgi:Holliday junction resolvasome RuvABC DNA-binding subunit